MLLDLILKTLTICPYWKVTVLVMGKIIKWHCQNSEHSSCLNVCAKSPQLCLTHCNPMSCSPPDSSVHRILQARILEWIAMTSSRGSSWPRHWTLISYVCFMVGRFFTTSTTWEAQHMVYQVKHSSKFLSRINKYPGGCTSWNQDCQEK